MTTKCPPTIPICTPATGCARGMEEMATAAEAAQMAMGSEEWMPS